jgi:FHA domain
MEKMVRAWGLVKGYTPVKINLPESGRVGRVKINVKTQLLRPAGKEIVATLHFNGTTVYLPKDANITIGSSPECDIRIIDPAVLPIHTLITLVGGNITVEHLDKNGRTGTLTAANKTGTVTAYDEPLALSNGDKVVLPLSGRSRLLPIEIKFRHALAEEIQTLLVDQLLRPTIPMAPADQVLAGQALVAKEPPPPFKTLVAGTPFVGERTLGKVLNSYPIKLKQAAFKDTWRILVAMLVDIGGVTMLSLSPLIPSTLHSLSLCYAAVGYAGLGLGLFSLPFYGFWGYRNPLKKSLAHILSVSDPKAVARAMAKLNGPEREKVLAALEKKNRPAADAVTAALREIGAE